MEFRWESLTEEAAYALVEKMCDMLGLAVLQEPATSLSHPGHSDYRTRLRAEIRQPALQLSLRRAGSDNSTSYEKFTKKCGLTRVDGLKVSEGS